jgi:hypothetical protein
MIDPFGAAHLRPIGSGWVPAYGQSSAGLRLWLGPSLDVLLALAPALSVLCARAGANARRASVNVRTALAATAVTVICFGLLVYLPDLYGSPDGTWYTRASLYLPFLAIGLVCGSLQPRSLVTAALLCLMLSNIWVGSLFFHAGWPQSTDVKDGLPLLLSGLLGAAALPLSRAFSRLEERPLQLLAGCNVLNIADAILTAVLLSRGAASEANPVVRLISLPGKVALVALASIAIYRWRPRALIWPVIGLALVIVWHVVGVLNTAGSLALE